MAHGGKRLGSGRPRGSNHWGEPTKPLRIPISRIEDVQIFLRSEGSTPQALPLYLSTVRAGFPSPADNTIDSYLDLNSHLIKHPASTFFVVASGDSMQGAGIHSGDLLIVDKSLSPSLGKIVIAALDGELTVKRLSSAKGKLQLLPENEDYPPLYIGDNQDLVIWGVVTHVIHACK